LWGRVRPSPHNYNVIYYILYIYEKKILKNPFKNL
jgi:hypothetical protein